MIDWFLRQLPTLLVRLAVTLSACLVLHHVVKLEGYHIELGTLLISAVCIIVSIRFWLPRCHDRVKP